MTFTCMPVGLGKGGLRLARSKHALLQERVDPESFLKAEELQEEEKIRGRWISDTPHSPEDDLDPALARAAFPVSGSKGLVIVTSGRRLFHSKHAAPCMAEACPLLVSLCCIRSASWLPE